MKKFNFTLGLLVALGGASAVTNTEVVKAAEDVPPDEEIGSAVEKSAYAAFVTQLNVVKQAMEEGWSPEEIQDEIDDAEKLKSDALKIIKDERLLGILNGQIEVLESFKSLLSDEKPGDKVETKQEVKKEVIKFKEEVKYNDQVKKGETREITPGKDGERTIIDEVRYVNDVEKSRTEISNKITIPVQNRVIEIGTKEPVIETKQETKTEVVKFVEERRNNNELKKGEIREITPGKDGERTIIEEVVIEDGVEKSRRIISNGITTKPQNRVIEVGTKETVVETKRETKTEVVKFAEERRENNELKKGETREVTPGKDGERTIIEEVTLEDGVEKSRTVVSNEITTPAQNRVIEVGTKETVVETKRETKTEVVKFIEERRENNELKKGETREITPGKDGERTIVEEVTFEDGVEKSRTVISNEITTPAVNRVIEVGTKEDSEIAPDEEIGSAEEKRAYVSFVSLVDELNTAVNEGWTKEEAVPLLDELVITKAAAEKAITEPALKAALAEQIARYEELKAKFDKEDNTTPKIETKRETKTEVVKFAEERRENRELKKGETREITPGKDGERTIIEEITLEDGVEKSRTVISNEITTPSQNRVIEVGTKETVVETKRETKTEVVKFAEERRENSELKKGETREITPGKDGERTIVEEVTFEDGVEKSRTVISNEITTPAVNRVIEVGTKETVVETKQETKTEVIKFTEERRENSELKKGEEREITPGKDGERTIVEEVTFEDGAEKSRTVISNEITTPAVNRVIEVGTKEVITDVPDNAPQDEEKPTAEIKQETKTETIKFKEEIIENNQLEKGTVREISSGKDGVRTIVEEVTFENGKEVSRKVISVEITTAPVSRVIEVGTKVSASTKGTESKTESKEEKTSNTNKLPNTGATTSTNYLASLILGALAILGFSRRKNK